MTTVISPKPKDPIRTIVFDLDGVVVDCSDRLRKYVDHDARRRGDHRAVEQSFLRYNQTIEGDKPIPMGLSLIHHLMSTMDFDRLIALTARDEISRDLTLGWLRENLMLSAFYRNYFGRLFRTEDLLMRPTVPLTGGGEVLDARPVPLDQAEYKRGRIQELEATGHEIILAIDDHRDICDMYQAHGIPTLRAMWPGIDCLTPSGECCAEIETNHPSLAITVSSDGSILRAGGRR